MKTLILPVGSVEAFVLDHLSAGIANTFGTNVVLGASVDVPSSAYQPERCRYLAGSFLDMLRPLKPAGGRVLGVTEVDLYTPGLHFVFGQADMKSGVCIISLARLRPDNVSSPLTRALKEAIHELGHTYGLAHCPDQRCVMHFSNSLPDTDYKDASFCPKCRPALFPDS